VTCKSFSFCTHLPCCFKNVFRFMKFFFQNIRLLFLTTILAWPLGGLGLKLGGLSFYLFRKFNLDARVFNVCVETLTTDAYTIIDEKMSDPDLKDKRDLLAIFMNSEVKCQFQFCPKVSTLSFDFAQLTHCTST
jgi:hypothetical protein